jgi:phosphate starvation-inducible protein PhoH and related proteins
LSKRPRGASRAQDNNKTKRSFRKTQTVDTNTVEDTKPQARRKQLVLIPKNIKQEAYIDYLEDLSNHIVVAMGSAGTGKTLIATTYAIKEFLAGNIQKIVITRPNVAVDDRDIGHLPGTLIEKMMPYVRPIMDIFLEYFTKTQMTKYLDDEIFEICPIAMIRGRTFKNSIVILDESQGLSSNALKAVLTRIGEGSRIIVTGDIEQSDIKDNGLIDFVKRIRGKDVAGIKLIEFNKKDVERHPMVTTVLNLYADGQSEDDLIAPG